MAKALNFVVCDTSILIEYLKDKEKIVDEIENVIGLENVLISSITEMELVIGARNKSELKAILKDISVFQVLHLNSHISKLAGEYVKKYNLSHSIDIPDALIAASAVYYKYPIYTLNIKHFKSIPTINLYKD